VVHKIQKGLEKYKKDREKWGCTKCFPKTAMEDFSKRKGTVIQPKI